MKKITILVILFMFLFSNIGLAAIELIERKKINQAGYYGLVIEIYCIDNYKWVAMRSSNGTVSLKQMFKHVYPMEEQYPPQPVICK